MATETENTAPTLSVEEIEKLEMSLPEGERKNLDNEDERERQDQINQAEEKLSPEERAQLNEFRSRKVQFFTQEALKYKSLLDIFKKEGDIFGRENRGWWAVTRHCLVASVLASVIAESLNNHGENVDQQAVTVGALFHDLTKRFEYSPEAKKFEQEGKGTPYEFAEEKTEEIFGNLEVQNTIKKFYPEVSKIKDLTQAAGNVFLTKKEGPEYLETLEERIIQYVDKTLKHSSFVALQEREADARKRYSHDLFETEFAYADKIGKELAEKLGIAQEQITDYVKSLVVERVSKLS